MHGKYTLNFKIIKSILYHMINHNYVNLIAYVFDDVSSAHFVI